MLTNWGTPLLVGPGSIHVAHTDEEHIAVDELNSAVDLYESLIKPTRCYTECWGVCRTAARTLCNFSLRTASGPEGSSAKSFP